MKAYVIQMSDNKLSLEGVETLKNSIETTSSKVELEIHEAVQPSNLGDSNFNIFGRTVPWTWPTESSSDAIDLHTGLYKRTYQAKDQRRVEACALSHFGLWKKCVEENKPFLVLEHDALFIKKFDPDKYSHKKWGVIGLNDPQGNTRKGSMFSRQVQSKGKGIHDVPTIDAPGEPPLPMGIAGNSAYMIKPHLAEKLLHKVEELGMWPNDAIMCKQLFPNQLKVVHPFYTTTQGTISTTVSL